MYSLGGTRPQMSRDDDDDDSGTVGFSGGGGDDTSVVSFLGKTTQRLPVLRIIVIMSNGGTAVISFSG